MMKKSVIEIIPRLLVLLLVLTFTFFTACKDGDEDDQDVTDIPGSPAGLTAESGVQVTLRFSAVSGADSYNIYMAKTTGVTSTNYLEMRNTASTEFIWTSPALGRCYFVVTAENSDGESGISNEVCAFVLDSGTKIIALGPADMDCFGGNVSISGDYAIAGAIYNTSNRGAAYIFRRTGTNTWDSVTKIIAKDPQDDDYFGYSVSISGDYAIVGAPYEDSGGDNSGAAYIFRRTGTNTWDDVIKIVAPVPAIGDLFGYSVSISGDYAIVGAPYENSGGTDRGAAYIFRRTGTNTWDGGTKIIATDPGDNDLFGISVSISSDYVIAGANTEDGAGTDRGAAYIFKRTGIDTWDGGTKIIATDPGDNDQFGRSVSISGSYAIVGAYNEDGEGDDQGAAYIYRRTGTNTWDGGTKIIATAPEDDGNFGRSVCISDDYVIVGAQGEDGEGTDRGAAYIFIRTGSNTWDSVIRIIAYDHENDDGFGSSVSISGDYAIAGASNEDGEGNNRGAAYIY
jgi:hypothetical protein